MAFISYSAREVNCKVVYYGPALSGKTAHLTYIYRKSDPAGRGKLISVTTETERTLFFDFLPLYVGSLRGMKIRLHLYTIPGQVFYDATRKMILRGLDGVVFVADSQPERMDENIESLDNLRTNLKGHGYDPDNIPYTIAYNKRDLPTAMPVEAMDKVLNSRPVQAYPSSAVTGEGVFDVLKDISKQVVLGLKDQIPESI
ncbi:MAG: gliding-motility protein MglA [Nitrospirae bacterium]|nr:MAG: gliding-motility protein MglA [Nitrospirota bacterium]